MTWLRDRDANLLLKSANLMVRGKFNDDLKSNF